MIHTGLGQDLRIQSSSWVFQLDSISKFGSVYFNPSSEIVDGQVVHKSYTPISYADTKGYCDLLIKIYRADGDYKGGIITSKIDRYEVGNYLTFFGPVGKFIYEGKGVINS